MCERDELAYGDETEENFDAMAWFRIGHNRIKVQIIVSRKVKFLRRPKEANQRSEADAKKERFEGIQKTQDRRKMITKPLKWLFSCAAEDSWDESKPSNRLQRSVPESKGISNRSGLSTS